MILLRLFRSISSKYAEGGIKNYKLIFYYATDFSLKGERGITFFKSFLVQNNDFKIVSVA